MSNWHDLTISKFLTGLCVDCCYEHSANKTIWGEGISLCGAWTIYHLFWNIASILGSGGTKSDFMAHISKPHIVGTVKQTDMRLHQGEEGWERHNTDIYSFTKEYKLQNRLWNCISPLKFCEFIF